MVSIIPPVNPNSTKEAIANLQTGLQILDFAIDAAEFQSQTYNDTTRRAVMKVQRGFNLNETDGFVGEFTARQLNEMLRAKGAFEPASFLFNARVIDGNSQSSVPNVNVEVWDKSNASNAPLGSATTNTDGAFQINLNDSIISQQHDLFFKVFRDGQLVSDTANSFLWHANRNDGLVIIPLIANGNNNGTGTQSHSTITGKVVTSSGVPLVKTKVTAFSKGLEEDKILGEAITGESGDYKILYKTEALQGAKPDLELHVFEPGNDQKETGRSAVKYNAAKDETIDVVINQVNVETLPEYDRLVKDLQPHLGRLSLQDLQETNGKDQVTYLSNKTAWDGRMIAMAVQANKLSSETGIPPEHYYALFRAGVENNAETLSKLSPQTTETILKKAAESKLIESSDQINSTVEKVRNFGVDFLLNNVFSSGVSSLGSMLSLRLNDDQKKLFVQTAKEAGGDTAKLWTGLKEKGVQPETIARLQLDGKLGYLTNQNAPLVKRLNDSHNINDPVDLIHEGFYKPEKWTDVIGADVPQGANAGEYAKHIATQLSRSYPTAVIAEMMKNDEIQSPPQAPKEEIFRFLNNNEQKFSIGIDPVKKWSGFNDLSEAGKEHAKTIERWYQLTPSHDSMKALSKVGLTSAYHIASYTRDEFMMKFQGEFTSTEEAALTYNKASEVQSAVMNVATAYLTNRAAPNIYSITGKLKKEENEIIAYPTLEELFGNMDYCSCDHCKSVLSPAAYLVDLLQFIDLADIPHDKQNPIDVLRERRPDIEHIQLSCANTNTVLPYIDLVNEVMEYYVVNGNLTAFEGHDNAEGEKTEDLLADPAFVMQAAYTEVKTKVYPYNLPFDYPLEALRLLFNAWDISLADVLLQFNNVLSAQKEVLNLNDEEYKILTGSSTHMLHEFFGEPSAADINALNIAIANGKTFSRRVDISYEDLVALLRTKFINPGIVLVPLLESLKVNLTTLQSFYDGTTADAAFDALLPATLDATLYNGNVKQWLRDNRQLIMGLITLTDAGPKTTECNFADVQLRFALPDEANNKLTGLAYDKLHRFIRLWKKSGWTIETTDNVLNALLPVPSEDINDANINASFTTLLARMANLKSVMKQLDANEKKLSQFLTLLDATKVLAARQIQLAGLLKISLEDLTDLSAITGIDPLANDLENDEPSLLRFVIAVQNLKAASLKIADLAFILQSKDAGGKLTQTEIGLLKNIKAIRDGLNAVEKEHSIAPDNADFAFAKAKMSLVYDAGVVNEFFGLLTDSTTYTSPLNLIEEGLPSKLTDANANLGFDAFKKQLTYKGILSVATQNALKAAADSLVLADMSLITVQADLDDFKTQFKTATDQLSAAGNDDLTAFANDYPELKTVYDNVKAQANPAAQTTALLNGILPELKKRLKTSAVKQNLSAVTKAEADIIDALTAKKETLHSASDSTKPVVYDFLQLEEKMVFNANQTYNFYIDAPATDDYLIYVKAPQNTMATLSINGEKIIDAVTIDALGEAKNAVPLNLKAGILNLCELTISGLAAGDVAELWWRTKGMAKAIVSNTNLYKKENVDFAKTSLIRMQKAAMLNRLLKLTADELTYFASQNSETINFLNELDTDGNISLAKLHTLCDKISLLIYFVGLKDLTEQEENTWVQILKNPEVKNAQGKSVLLNLNNWSQADLDIVLPKLAVTIADLSRLSVLKKVNAAMEIISAIGYPAADVAGWATGTPTINLIDTIKEKIKNKTDKAAWLETMQSVSDALRNKQRDALVSYVLHHKRPSSEVDTADKLYEYFLIDVQMDACMKTSRIKQAISTVQLFIYRCLMNLEPKVAPASIRAQQWEWMKRYRVWEANRKVFLYPENWLEPELRDNKSSFFKELEGELLQSDINHELAESAFLNYLKKLDDIARLEMIGMYLEENEKGNQDDDVLHIFGRTNGSTRQYYYRRYEYGYWTPWEKISLNVEGEHFFPVVWKKRLFVFWLTIVQKPADVNRGQNLVDMSKQPWGDNAKVNIEITMYWGEYYKGKWTSPKSTELKKPIRIDGIDDFQPANVLLYARKEKKDNLSERLIFNLFYIGKSTFMGNGIKAFTITYTSKNAPPLIDETSDAALQELALFNYGLYRSPYGDPQQTILDYNSIIALKNGLSLNIKQPANATKDTVTENLLTKSSLLSNYFKVLTLRHVVENQWEAPFFYDDERNTFFVTQDEEVFTSVRQYEGYFDVGIYDPHIKEVSIPPLVEEPVHGWPPINENPFNLGDIVTNPWVNVETGLTKNANFKRVISDQNMFSFGENAFSAGGKLPGALKDVLTNKGF